MAAEVKRCWQLHGPCWVAGCAIVTLLGHKRPTSRSAFEAAFFDNGFLGRGIVFEDGMEALEAAINAGASMCKVGVRHPLVEMERA